MSMGCWICCGVIALVVIAMLVRCCCCGRKNCDK